MYACPHFGLLLSYRTRMAKQGTKGGSYKEATALTAADGMRYNTIAKARSHGWLDTKRSVVGISDTKRRSAH